MNGELQRRYEKLLEAKAKEILRQLHKEEEQQKEEESEERGCTYEEKKQKKMEGGQE